MAAMQSSRPEDSCIRAATALAAALAPLPHGATCGHALVCALQSTDDSVRLAAAEALGTMQCGSADVVGMELS